MCIESRRGSGYRPTERRDSPFAPCQRVRRGESCYNLRGVSCNRTTPRLPGLCHLIPSGYQKTDTWNEGTRGRATGQAPHFSMTGMFASVPERTEEPVPPNPSLQVRDLWAPLRRGFGVRKLAFALGRRKAKASFPLQSALRAPILLGLAVGSTSRHRV
jgi:hypothetical protein